MPAEQELVVHLYAPATEDAEDGLRAIWARCRALGAVHPVPNTGLPAALPGSLRSSRPDCAVAAARDGAADIQAVLRRSHDVLNLSLAFTAPDSPTGRPGSGWITFDQRCTDLVGDAADLLGTTRVFQAKHPTGADDAVPAALPVHLRDRFRWATPEVREGVLTVLEPVDDVGTDRVLVVLAPAGHDAVLSAWTWSRGTAEMPPLARYLMHTTRLRHSIGVLHADTPALDRLRARIHDEVHRADLGRPVAVALTASTSALRRLRRAAEIDRTNMAAVFPRSLAADDGLAEWVDRQLDHALERLDEDRRLVDEVRTLRPPVPVAEVPGGRAIRMGFMLDMVGYGGREPEWRAGVQGRLAALANSVLHDLGTAPSAVDRQDTGDGLLAFLPAGCDVHRALPLLLRRTADRLAHDNTGAQDRLRLRMAVVIGPVGRSELGFSGATATVAGRLLDCAPLREQVLAQPERDLAVVLSRHVHEFVVAEGVPGLPREQFSPVTVRVKELTTEAWLWTG
ncbi:CATRA conflict system CASPASE/TPR repeat-associated protein [Saccharothrix sp. Mg75]|uniref:CATRA conflict system CASPASE/TPR repeat-associated protein n=1 Tax=Saccharothrix sp. Mg75 TaxID=3445357 RepID=UPI003EEC4D6B